MFEINILVGDNVIIIVVDVVFEIIFVDFGFVFELLCVVFDEGYIKLMLI